MKHSTPWWVRAYLLLGAAQGLNLGLTGLLEPGQIQIPVSMSPLNARFIAALYLAASLGALLSAFVRERADARIFVMGLGLATGLVLIVTVLHWSEFMADPLPHRQSWLIAYVVDPVLAALVVWAARLLPPRRPSLHRLTPLFTVEAAVFGGLGLLLLLAPDVAAAGWPWSLSPLLAQLYSCFFLTFAIGALLAARESRPVAIRIFTMTSLALVILVLLASLLHLPRFTPGLAAWLWFGGLVTGLCVFAFALVWWERSGRIVTPRPAP